MNPMMPTDFNRLLVDGTSNALMAVTPDGRVLCWNRGAEVLFGYSSAEAVGCALCDLIVEPDRVAEEQGIQREALNSEVTAYESVRRKKDGSLIYVSVSIRAVRGAGGEAECLVINTKDITKLRVLRDSKLLEARYRDLLESTPDAIVIVNPTGSIVLVNGQAETMFGYGRAEFIAEGM
jgi:PAS domain S-box-containing protein